MAGENKQKQFVLVTIWGRGGGGSARYILIANAGRAAAEGTEQLVL